MNTGIRQFALQLALAPGIGGKSLRRVLLRMDMMGHTPTEFFGLSAEGLRESYGLDRRVAATLSSASPEDRERALRDAMELEARGIQLVTSADAQYPASLEEFDPDPPPLLFFYGNMKLLESRRFAVLCSNGCPLRALEDVERLAESGVLASETLVSGANRSPYQRAAIVPLRWGSPRILCLDRGFFSVLGESLNEEPFSSARLWRYRFDPETDLVVSPFRPRATYNQASNKVRDRLVGGLAGRLDFAFVRPGGVMESLLSYGLACRRPVRVSSLSPEWQAYVERGAALIEAKAESDLGP